MKVINLLSAAAVTGVGTAVCGENVERTFQATGATTAGTGSASVNIEVSNDGIAWLTLGTISLVLGTTVTTDGFASSATWYFARANITAISGTGAAVTVTMGI